MEVLKQIPNPITPLEIMSMIESGDIDSKYLYALKCQTDFSDDIISGWLNMNVKTYRQYKKKVTTISADVQEHAIMLLALMKHGEEVFGSKESFTFWLDTENFLVGNKKPMAYLNTINGIQFIDDRLTAMEYGDNI